MRGGGMHRIQLNDMMLMQMVASTLLPGLLGGGGSGPEFHHNLQQGPPPNTRVRMRPGTRDDEEEGNTGVLCLIPLLLSYARTKIPNRSCMYVSGFLAGLFFYPATQLEASNDVDTTCILELFGNSRDLHSIKAKR